MMNEVTVLLFDLSLEVKFSDVFLSFVMTNNFFCMIIKNCTQLQMCRGVCVCCFFLTNALTHGTDECAHAHVCVCVCVCVCVLSCTCTVTNLLVHAFAQTYMCVDAI